MKKYLIIVSLFVVFLGIGYYFYYFDGSLYVPQKEEKKEVHYAFQVQGQELIQTSSKKKEPFIVKGVTLESSQAGFHRQELSIDKDTYLDWMGKMAEMGVNTIRVRAVMDADFYEALAYHNLHSSDTLYLMQGIGIDESMDNSSVDAFDELYLGEWIQNAKVAVDVVHGRKQIWNNLAGNQNYQQDVSKWVLSYVVGDYWNSGMIAYTNHQQSGASYRGNYISARSKANPFEVMLAQVMDELVSYETDKYDWQHLVTFANSPSTDPFLYREPFAAQAPKYSQLDISHFESHNRFQTGLFASYQLLDYHPKLMDYILADGTDLDLKKYQKLNYPANYISMLTAYHKEPLVVLGYGYSTSRGVISLQQRGIDGPLTEKEQGQLLVKDYKAFIDSGTMGAVISSWQDDWSARAWNTSFSTNRHTNFLWGNVQDYDSGFGLVGFRNQKKNHQIDGKKTEWSTEVLLKESKTSLRVDSDEEFLYLSLEKKGLSPDDTWILPLDITGRSGSKSWSEGGVTFQKPADFLLVIDGKENSRLMVQERYDAVRANYLMQTAGEDPYIKPPEVDSPNFHTVNMVVKHNLIFDDIERTPREKKWNPLYPTGKLQYGNGNRYTKNFDSQSDIFFGKDFVEVRIPWQLLNFSNLAFGAIHDDYYQHYGVEEIEIEQIAIGLAKYAKGEHAKMITYPLPTWERPDVEEFYKESYYMLKYAWK